MAPDTGALPGGRADATAPGDAWDGATPQSDAPLGSDSSSGARRDGGADADALIADVPHEVDAAMPNDVARGGADRAMGRADGAVADGAQAHLDASSAAGGAADSASSDPLSPPDVGVPMDSVPVDTTPGCLPDETYCGLCTVVDTDPDNCGRCGSRCGGLCVQGVCQAQGAGHVVVIGHDYTSGRTGMNSLVGNAVFIAPRSPVRVLAYEGAASAASIRGTNAAIDELADSTGRRWSRTPASAASMTTLLPLHDVVLIYAQGDAADNALGDLGRQWAEALKEFVDAGKTVVLLDGASSSNTGTFRVLEAAELFKARSRTDATGELLIVTSPGDAVANQVPRRYRGEESTVGFDTTGQNVVVTTAAGAPVVIHVVF